MIRAIIKYGINLAFLVLLQILVLNRIEYLGFINPYLYILFILTLPFELPSWAVLLIAFLTGLSIDLFSFTPGVHLSATVFLGFMRNIVLSILEPRDGYETGTSPSVASYGWGWFLRYSILLVACHHIFLFTVEAFSFSHFNNTLLKFVSSSAFTLVLIALSQSTSRKKGSTGE